MNAVLRAIVIVIVSIVLFKAVLRDGLSIFPQLAAPTTVTEATTVKAVESAYDRVLRTGVLRCGFAAWPPFFVLDPNTKELTGIWKELIDPTIALIGWKIEYVEILPEQKIALLENGKIDATCGDGPWIANSIKYMGFVKPFLFAPVMAYVRTDDNSLLSLADLNREGIKFVGIDGDLSVDIAQRSFPQAHLQTLTSNTDPSQMFLNVVTKKADVTLNDTVTFATFDKSNPNKLKLLSQQPVAVYGGSFGVLKKEHALYDTLDELTELSLNLGIVDQVLDKHDPERKLFLRTAKSYEPMPQTGN